MIKRKGKTTTDENIVAMVNEVMRANSSISDKTPIRNSKTSNLQMDAKLLLKGHRQRLREKFIKSKDALDDYELLEMLLFLSNIRKDTRNTARLLLKKFGSLTALFSSPLEDLNYIPELGKASIVVLKLFYEIHLRMLREQLNDKKISVELDSICKTKEYCRAAIGHLKQEQLLVMFLNNKSMLVAQEVISCGNSVEVKLYKNLLITRATQLGSPAIVLAHNHPTGDPSPSIQDIEITLELKGILEQVGIKLLDHVIVSAGGTFSMCQKCLLNSSVAEIYKNNRRKEEGKE